MKKVLLLGLILILTGCKEANEIFGGDEYWERNNEIVIFEKDNEYHYEGPVYINATSWGSVAYVSYDYVNCGVQLLISESSNAEGGKVLEVDAMVITIDGLNPNTQYYYCLVLPETGIKSEIKKVVVPDVSSLYMTVSQEEDKVICSTDDEISPSFILERGFKIYNEFKYVPTGEEFAFSIPEVMQEFGFTGDLLSCYAYVVTPNAYFRTREYTFQVDASFGEDEVQNINREDITVSEITEETIGDVDYLKCTVTGYVDEAYFGIGHDFEYYGNILYPDKVVTNDDGTVTSFYLKKGVYQDVCCSVYYYKYYSDNYFRSYSKKTGYYTPTNYNIRSLEDFLEFVSFEGSRFDDEEKNEYFTTITLHEDITLPSDIRLNLNLENVTLDGNGHTLDGISYFPLFRSTYGATTIKNLKFGTDQTVYDVKKGTSSVSTTSSETPGFLLTEGDSYSHYSNNYTFENCEIRGTIQVSGRDDFYVTKAYLYYWSDEDKAAGTFDGYIVRVPGLKDYTKTEFK